MRARSITQRHRGYTLVELMVGTAIGLVVVASVTTTVVQQIGGLRAFSREARLTQDLRHVADIIVRDLRRAGHWAGAASGVTSDDGNVGRTNPYAFDAASAVDAGGVLIRYSRDVIENGIVDRHEQFGFRLRRGAIELQLGDANWQQVTDPATVEITRFDVIPTIETTPLGAFCSEPCVAGSTTCPPRQQRVRFDVALSGRSRVDATVVREVRSTAMLRHGAVIGACDV